MTTTRGLIWTTAPGPDKKLRSEGYKVVHFSDIRRDHIEPARRSTIKRTSLARAAETLLGLLDENPKLAIVGVPAATAGDIADIYSYLVEPAFRRDVTLLLGVDREIEDIAGTSIDAGVGYPWSLERLVYLTARYRRATRDDGLPPLTPIEESLLIALREAQLVPEVQYGIGRYRVDFAIPEVRLAVEADGRDWHDTERDRKRDDSLRSLGWEVMRLTGSEIHRDAKGAAKAVADASG